ncbi:MAG: MFS transporter [archaeon]|nr:MFS transporter [archaeon]
MNKKNSFLILILLTIDALALTNLTGPMIELIANGLNISSKGSIGYIEAIFLLVGAFSSMIWAILGNKYSRKKMLMLATLDWSIFSLLSAFSVDFNSLLFFQILTAIGFGAVIPLTYSITLDLVDAEKRGRMLGLLISANALGSGWGLILGGVVSDFTSWQIPFIIISILGFSSVLEIYFMYNPKRGEMEKLYAEIDDDSLGLSYNINFKDLKEIFNIKSNRWLLILNFFQFLAVGPTTYFFVDMLITDHDFSSTIATIFMLIIYCSNLIGAPYFGKIGDDKKLKDETGRIKVILLCFIGPIFYVIGYSLSFTSSDLIISLICLCILFFGALFVSGIDPLSSATLGELNPPKVRATIFSLNMVAQTVGRSIGIVIMILIFESSGQIYQIGFILMGILLIVCVLFVIPLKKTLIKDIQKIKEKS